MKYLLKTVSTLLLVLGSVTSGASENDRRMLNVLADSDQDWMQAFAVHALPAFDAEELLTELAGRRQLSPHAAYLVSLACAGSAFEQLCNENALHLKALNVDSGNLADVISATHDRFSCNVSVGHVTVIQM